MQTTTRYPQALALPPFQPLTPSQERALWAAVVAWIMLATTAAAHAEPPSAARKTQATCEVCIPQEYKEACEDAASDAQAYYGEVRAVTRRAREAEERAREAELARALARLEAERQGERVWWYFAGGAGSVVVVVVSLLLVAR
jgi:hypothetical protein